MAWLLAGVARSEPLEGVTVRQKRGASVSARGAARRGAGGGVGVGGPPPFSVLGAHLPPHPTPARGGRRRRGDPRAAWLLSLSSSGAWGRWLASAVPQFPHLHNSHRNGTPALWVYPGARS